MLRGYLIHFIKGLFFQSFYFYLYFIYDIYIVYFFRISLFDRNYVKNLSAIFLRKPFMGFFLKL